MSYDIEEALRQIAIARRSTDRLTTAKARTGDHLASRLSRELPPAELEAAGKALLVAAASVLGDLCCTDPNHGHPPVPEANAIAAHVLGDALGFAGQRLVVDARAAAAAEHYATTHAQAPDGVIVDEPGASS